MATLSSPSSGGGGGGSGSDGFRDGAAAVLAPTVDRLLAAGAKLELVDSNEPRVPRLIVACYYLPIIYDRCVGRSAAATRRRAVFFVRTVGADEAARRSPTAAWRTAGRRVVVVDCDGSANGVESLARPWARPVRRAAGLR